MPPATGTDKQLGLGCISQPRASCIFHKHLLRTSLVWLWQSQQRVVVWGSGASPEQEGRGDSGSSLPPRAARPRPAPPAPAPAAASERDRGGSMENQGGAEGQRSPDRLLAINSVEHDHDQSCCCQRKGGMLRPFSRSTDGAELCVGAVTFLGLSDIPFHRGRCSFFMSYLRLSLWKFSYFFPV